jgi:hypothetical protein
MKKEIIEKFYKAWHFLENHPIYNINNTDNKFLDNLNIMVVKVNPETNEIDDNDEKNIKVQIWLESGPIIIERIGHGCGYSNKIEYCHDINLDCGADTFEEAIIKLAELVKSVYGDYNNVIKAVIKIT